MQYEPRTRFRRIPEVLACLMGMDSLDGYDWELKPSGDFTIRQRARRSAWINPPELSHAQFDLSEAIERLIARGLLPDDITSNEGRAFLRMSSTSSASEFIESHTLPFPLLWQFASESEVMLANEARAKELCQNALGYTPRIIWDVYRYYITDENKQLWLFESVSLFSPLRFSSINNIVEESFAKPLRRAYVEAQAAPGGTILLGKDVEARNPAQQVALDMFCDGYMMVGFRTEQAILMQTVPCYILNGSGGTYPR